MKNMKKLVSLLLAVCLMASLAIGASAAEPTTVDVSGGTGTSSVSLSSTSDGTLDVTGAYRHVLDDVWAGRTPDRIWRDEVEHVSHRHYSTGFYYGQPGQFTENSRYLREWQICAVVEKCDAEGNAVLSLRNKFAAGDTVEVVGPDLRPFSWQVPPMENLDGVPLLEPRTPQMRFRAKLPKRVPPLSFIRHAVELSGR